MCGFTGYLQLEGALETSNTTIRQMLALQQHRGPDDSGVVAIHRAGARFEEVSAHSDVTLQQPADLMFGFNRLSILDLSPMGHQPMISPDGQVVLMMNGEVYNAFDYKPELEALGHRFKSTSDTEVVLHLYLEYGMNGMIQRLNGMFALAIYDFRLGTLFLTRDRFGIKPLYVLREAGRIAFASEMKSFKALPNFRFEADYSGIDAFLLFRNGINQTLFKNIENCPPGVYLSIQGSEIKTHTYYRLNSEGQSSLRTDAKEVLDQALRRSVRSQMISDVKLGCQLSGGVDSSLVTYYAAEALQEGQLETISIIFDDPKFSEAKYIQQVADQLKLQAHQYVMDGRYYFNTLQQATWHFEQPLNHPNTIGIYLLSQEAKKHVTVLLSGEGADESLAGYSRFITAATEGFLSKTLVSKARFNRNHLLEFLSYYQDADRRMIMGSAYGSLQTAYALKADFSLQAALAPRLDILKGLSGNTVLRHRKYELSTYLPDLLMRQDKMSMAHSIENRVPFLDNDMVSTAMQLEAPSLIAQHNQKYEAKFALKQVCAQKFDKDFAFRNKMGFGIPLRQFMAEASFQNQWQEQWLPGIRNRGVFAPQHVDQWVKGVGQATAEQLDAIWLMVGFETWAQQYLDQ